MSKPLAVDLFCGLGGWSEGLLAEGWHCLGFDIEQHVYGDQRYPGSLCIQDVLTIHGSQFKTAALIVASPPCQDYSYMAMPWSLAKAKAAAIRADESGQAIEDLNRLFHACFRIQREACEAAGRHIPLVVENVRGAQDWVGKARWNFGSYYLFGDVPALMPPIKLSSATKVPSQSGCRTDPGKGARFTSRDCGVEEGRKHHGDWFRDPACPSGQGGQVRQRITPQMASEMASDGRKQVGSGQTWFDQGASSLSSNSPARKAASAMIAKIPLPLSRHIARVYRPA